MVVRHLSSIKITGDHFLTAALMVRDLIVLTLPKNKTKLKGSIVKIETMISTLIAPKVC